MSIIDGVIFVFMLLLLAGILVLAYERQNGHVNSEEPEPTLRRQLESCIHKLATAEQSVDVWRTVAAKQKAIIDDMARVLEDDDG